MKINGEALEEVIAYFERPDVLIDQCNGYWSGEGCPACVGAHMGHFLAHNKAASNPPQLIDIWLRVHGRWQHSLAQT